MGNQERNEKPLKFGSMCSGYGGLDLAVQAVFGARIVWHVENADAPSKVLEQRWPGVPNHRDVQTTDWAAVERVDGVCVGYPCQPDSFAGKGLSEDDDRWIWPDIERALGVLRPRYVVLENVQGHFVRGFRTVLGSLAALGFDAQWTLVRASDVGAPHRRERLFVVATYTGSEHGIERRVAASGQAPRGWALGELAGRRGAHAAHTDEPGPQGSEPAQGRHLPDRGAAAHTDSARSQRDGAVAGRPELSDADRTALAAPDADSDALREQPVSQLRGRDQTVSRDAGDGDAPAWGVYEPAIRRWETTIGRLAPAPTEQAPKGGQRLAPAFVEWMMGLPAGWVTDVPGISRNEQLRMLGNGVVPQQAAAALAELVQVDERDGVGVRRVSDRVGVRRPVAADQVGSDRDERGADRSLDLAERPIGGGGGEDGERCHVVEPGRPASNVNSRPEVSSVASLGAAS